MVTTKCATSGLFDLAVRTPINIAPEKANELATEVFKSEDWGLLPSETEANFYAVVEHKAIYLSYSGLASLWCVAFTAFCVMDLMSRAVRDAKPEVKQIDFGECWRDLKLGSYVAFARRLVRQDEDWPDDLVGPDSEACEDSTEGRVNNLFFGALSWVMLHEIAHIHHGDSKYIPSAMRVGQEYKADAFATDWVLSEAGTGLHREFRVLAICVALAWLIIHDQAKGHGSNHPAAVRRFMEAVTKFETGEHSVALENAAYMLKAIFLPEINMPIDLLPRPAFEWVCDQLFTRFDSRN